MYGFRREYQGGYLRMSLILSHWFPWERTALGHGGQGPIEGARARGLGAVIDMKECPVGVCTDSAVHRVWR